MSGILPISQSTTSEFVRVGQGKAFSECGSWRTKGCLNVEAHVQDGILEAMAGKVFIRRYRNSCHRAECPTCYKSWAMREAEKIVYRLAGCRGVGRSIHVIVSVPRGWYSKSLSKIRAKVYSVSKMSGILGGSVIFHAERQAKLTKKWYFSPHFHIIGYGWVRGTKEGYIKHGFVVKNVGIRRTVLGTAFYQLSHASVSSKHHAVTWFGKMSYNNLHVLPMVKDPEVCPICGQLLRDLWYFGSEDLPEVEGDFWLDPEGWVYKPRRWDHG
jgi:hypothetical protein